MADNNFYVTAGLAIAKTASQEPDAGDNSFYVTAGLPPDIDVAAGGLYPWINRINEYGWQYSLPGA